MMSIVLKSPLYYLQIANSYEEESWDQELSLQW